MCGIAGFFQAKAATQDQLRGVLMEQLRSIVHRGPDGEGQWIEPSLGLALGQRRLAIIDLSEGGKQPMVSGSGRFVITFNGEIYNYKDLRKELESKGRKFRSESDTEVMLEAFEEWGVQGALARFNGMFAFGLVDISEGLFYLARDRFGEKPLYYQIDENGFAFASELKALRPVPGIAKEIHRDALALYFRFNCVPAPYSIYRGIKKLLPATFLEIPIRPYHAWTLEPKPYWKLYDVLEEGAKNTIQEDEDSCLEMLDDVLRRAVKIRMYSDVPLGAFLSGGIDSSLTVALMQAQSNVPVKTFTIGSDNQLFNEAIHAKEVAKHLGTDHTELYVSGADALAVVPQLCEIYDEPFADSSQIPTYLVSKLARTKVTVALSGDAGDEIFGGYNRYVWVPKVWGAIRWLPRSLRNATGSLLLSRSESQWDSIYSCFAGFLPKQLRFAGPGQKIHRLASYIRTDSETELFFNVLSHWRKPTDLVKDSSEPSLLHSLPHLWPKTRNITEQMMYVDAMTYMPDDILVKTDRATMRASLEGRVPFLDPAVVEFAARLPLNMKVHNGITKYALKRLLTRKYVPSQLIDRPKMGFGIPIGDWLRGQLRHWAQDLLSSDSIRKDGILDEKPIEVAWREHLTGSNRYQYLLWDVLMFQSWKERWTK